MGGREPPLEPLPGVYPIEVCIPPREVERENLAFAAHQGQTLNEASY